MVDDTRKRYWQLWGRNPESVPGYACQQLAKTIFILWVKCIFQEHKGETLAGLKPGSLYPKRDKWSFKSYISYEPCRIFVKFHWVYLFQIVSQQTFRVLISFGRLRKSLPLTEMMLVWLSGKVSNLLFSIEPVSTNHLKAHQDPRGNKNHLKEAN